MGEGASGLARQRALGRSLDPAATGQEVALLGQRSALRVGEPVHRGELLERGGGGQATILSVLAEVICAWKVPNARRKPALSARTGLRAGLPGSVELRDT